MSNDTDDASTDAPVNDHCPDEYAEKVDKAARDDVQTTLADAWRSLTLADEDTAADARDTDESDPDSDARMIGTEWDELIGEECPECGEPMPPGSLRFAGGYWEHKSANAHPQAGHHQIDAAAILSSEGSDA